MNGERFKTLVKRSRSLMTIGLSRFPLNLSCSFHWPTSHPVQMSLKLFNRLLQQSDTVECDRHWKLDGDLSEVLALLPIVKVLKVKVKVRVWNFGGQLEHR